MARQFNGRTIDFSTNGAGTTRISTCKRMKSKPYLRLHPKKINSKWIKNLKVRAAAIKLLTRKHRSKSSGP